jgi:enamine deaminase RidA (YjgF/YER057c/UK114 family)
MKKSWMALLFLLSGLLFSGPPDVRGADVRRVRHAGGQGNDSIARVVSVGKLAFPSGAMGASGDPLVQVDEAVEQLHKTLGEIGLGIGNMVQHTIYVKDGAVQPTAVLARFHAAARRLAPGLLQKPSVGTILRVPAFRDPQTLVMIDMVAANPGKGKPDEFLRYPFTFGPKEIAETYTVDNLVFTAGMEAMDFEKGVPPPNDIDVQIDVIVNKIQGAFRKSGLTIGDMVAHNLYVTRGTDPMRVIRRFHETARALAPALSDRPSVGTLAIVDGMAGPTFLLEVDAIAAHPKQKGRPDGNRRVPFVPPMEIARSVEAGDLILLAGMEGAEAGGVSPNVLDQVSVAVRKIDDTLRQSGLSIANMVKHKLYVKQGSDIQAVVGAFHRAATRLAPGLVKHPSAETVIVVEGLASPELLFEAGVIAAR